MLHRVQEHAALLWARFDVKRRRASEKRGNPLQRTGFRNGAENSQTHDLLVANQKVWTATSPLALGPRWQRLVQSETMRSIARRGMRTRRRAKAVRRLFRLDLVTSHTGSNPGERVTRVESIDR